MQGKKDKLHLKQKLASWLFIIFNELFRKQSGEIIAHVETLMFILEESKQILNSIGCKTFPITHAIKQKTFLLG